MIRDRHIPGRPNPKKPLFIKTTPAMTTQSDIEKRMREIEEYLSRSPEDKQARVEKPREARERRMREQRERKAEQEEAERLQKGLLFTLPPEKKKI